jgi:P pilus assembly protein, chaperone PapD
MIRSLIKGAALAAAFGPLCAPASASVVMNATRYVYPADASEITVKVSNVGKVPALVQAWIDDGDAKAVPETVDVPFNLTPPIARLEAGKSQTLRIHFTEGALPADRESLFWLNVLEVPPKPDGGAVRSHLQLALRYRLKMFYRPAALKGTPDGAAASLAWVRQGDGISVRNDSDYHVAINHLTIGAGDTALDLEPLSVAPHSVRDVAMDGQRIASGATSVHFQTINDYGGFVEHDAPLAP